MMGKLWLILFFLFSKFLFALSMEDSITKAKAGEILDAERLTNEKNNLDIASQFSQYLLPSVALDAGAYSVKPVGDNSLRGGLSGNNVLLLPNSGSSILMYGATINQNLSIHKIIPGILYLKQAYKMNLINYNGLVQNFVLQVVELYANILSLTKSIEVYNQRLQIITKELNSSEIKAKYGIVGKNQMNLIEARIFEIKNKIKEAELQLKYYSNEYLILIGEEPASLFFPTLKPLPFSSSEEFLERVKANNLKISAANEEVKLSELEYNSSATNLLPDLYGVAGYKSIHSIGGPSTFLFNSLYVGGNISFTINASRDNTLGVIKAAKKMKISAIQSRANISKELIMSNMIWESYFVGLDSYKASELKIRTLQDTIADLKIKISYGTSNLIQYLQIENELLEAELQKINAQKNIVINYYKILAASGLSL